MIKMRGVTQDKDKGDRHGTGTGDRRDKHIGDRSDTDEKGEA